MGVESSSSAPPLDVVSLKGHPPGPNISQPILVKTTAIPMKIYITHLYYSSWFFFLKLFKAI